METRKAAQKGPRVLVFDIETGGVRGLTADSGFCIVFGWLWLGEKKAHTISVLDYPGKHLHDDTNLLKHALEIMNQADGLVAHFGSKFDLPYLQARLLRAGLPPIADNKLTDTCLISRAKLRLSSNRLGSIAAFLGCENQKMEKRGGFPEWWMGALRGDKASIRKMAAYCEMDVLCLRDVYLKMRHLIPTKYLPVNAAIGETLWTCSGCGGHKMQHRGWYYSEKKRWRRYACNGCGRWSHAAKAEARTPVV